MLISDEVVLRLNALSALWSRKLPLPDSYSAPEPENRLHEPAEALPVIPEHSGGQRMDRPWEIEPDGRVKTQGYKRRSGRGDWSDWDVPINYRNEA